MKKIADTTEAIVPIPLIVVAIDVDLALVVPPVEDGVALCEKSSVPLPIKCSLGCIVFGIVML